MYTFENKQYKTEIIAWLQTQVKVITEIYLQLFDE